ncbi:hypothetical protein B0H10DRAFT_2161908 [Mycena sp. CBHHK59/15]|nr:hypothetical protein B0H10DRAFT_2161908 [Mycena sp. CBHHK59/15]
MKTLNKLKVVARDLKGSTGYKQCRRNEVRAMMKKLSTPALYITINPSNICDPLLGAIAGIDPNIWSAMKSDECTIFIVLFGRCKGFHAMVEAQGRGTLHTYMVVWIEGNPSPQDLHDRM